MKLKFSPRDWDEVTRYLQEWDEWRREGRMDMPDYTTDAMYLVPYTIALIKAQERMEHLTWALISLTIVLIALTAILAF